MKAAIASFRHCLETGPENARARRDIELVRQWIKYYTDRWHAHDRDKRRQEMNLVAFLEFLIETQRALRESVKALPPTSPADAFADPKRVQDELFEEIAPLKEKIKTELTPQQSGGAAPPPGSSKELEQGIALLQGWAGAAGDKMQSASSHLDGRQVEPATAAQQAAIEELEKIWDAVIPFHPLLARDLADQTKITQSLAPATPADPDTAADQTPGKIDPDRDQKTPAPKTQSPVNTPPTLMSANADLEPLTELEQRTLRRTQLLKLKAEAELLRLEKSPPNNPEKKRKSLLPHQMARRQAHRSQSPSTPRSSRPVFRKRSSSHPRRPTRSIAPSRRSSRRMPRPPTRPPKRRVRFSRKSRKPQPKQDQQDQKQQQEDQKKNDQQKQDQKDQKNDDQQKKDQQKNDQQKKDDPKKKDQDKKDQEKKDQEEKKQEQNKQEQKKPDDKDKSGDQKQDPKQQASRDRIEEALRKVRERQQEKRDRDRRMNVRVLGRAPVEKDW